MPIRLNGAVVDERTLRAIAAFVLLYIGFFAVGAGLIALDSAFHGPPMSAFDAIAVAATTIGNVGPGLGFAGPMGSFEPFSDFSTIVMIVLMWLGRLEIIPDRRAADAQLLARLIERSADERASQTVLEPGLEDRDHPIARADHGLTDRDLADAVARHRDEADILREREAGNALAGSGRVACDLHLDDLEPLLS